MLNAYIVDCVRSASGKRGGALSEKHPSDFGGEIIDALIKRTHIDGALVDDVIFGCVGQVGSQAANLARNCVLSSSLPISVPGTTVDRQCGSSLQAAQFAAQAVMSGTQDVVIAGGVEIMSLVPIGSMIRDGMAQGRGVPFGEEMQRKFPEATWSQFDGAELLAEKYDVTREELEEFALLSHRRAAEASDAGLFKNEIVPVLGKDGKQLTRDEQIRWPNTAEKLAKMRTLKEGGRITAATSSPITDGASAVLIVNERGLKKLGVRPRARIVAVDATGADPVVMLGGPIPGSRNVLKKAGMTIDQMDIYEVNEAFASVPLALIKDLKGDIRKLNVNGSAMALGHALGSTGTRIITTAVNVLEQRKQRYALISICEGGGTANSMILERVAGAAKL